VKGEAYFKRLVCGRNLTPLDSFVLFVLQQLAHLYSLIMSLRAIFYRMRIFRSYALPKPVISIGNIVVGGTGKTPMTLWIASYLMSHGKKVVVLTRGYGGRLEGTVAVVSDGKNRILSAQDAGDEPALLADLLPGLIVVMGSNRYAAGCHALEKFDPDFFLIDDGFQHLRLKRDLDILLLDAAKPFGNGRTFPGGLLREDITASRRADLVVFTRCKDGTGPETDLFAGLPIAHACHRLTGFTGPEKGEIRPFESLSALKGLAFAGIADPDDFFASLEAAGLKLTATLSFPDHTDYGDEELTALAKLRLSSRADYLITTAKDAVKLHSDSGWSGPFYTAALEVAFHNEKIIQKELDKLLLSR